MLTDSIELTHGNRWERFSFRISLVLLGLLALLFIFPLYWMVKGALQPASASLLIPPTFLPTRFVLKNFAQLFTQTLALRWFLNSAIVAGCSTGLTLLFASLSGYAFAKKRFPGRELIFWILLTAMMVPKQVMLIPLYILMNHYGLYNTYPGMFLPMVAWPFGLFLMRQFMQSIPDDLIQAAKIDGAGEVKTFTQVIVPMSIPAFGTVGILYFINTWNDYMWQLVVVKSLAMSTLPVGIAKVSRTQFDINYGLLMAGATFGAIPMTAIFLFFQRYFVRGLTMGALKG